MVSAGNCSSNYEHRKQGVYPRFNTGIVLHNSDEILVHLYSQYSYPAVPYRSGFHPDKISRAPKFLIFSIFERIIYYFRNTRLQAGRISPDETLTQTMTG